MIEDYLSGGVLNNVIVARYGAVAGQQINDAALTGDTATINATLSDIRRNTTNENYSEGGDASVNGDLNPSLGSTSIFDNFVANIKGTFNNSIIPNIDKIIIAGAVVLVVFVLVKRESNK